MLNIYYADAMTDGEKFIFDHIDPDQKAILLVPDQFSLRAEQDALEHSPHGVLLNLMVTDFSALGHKVVKETRGREPDIIDKYGRHMLLTVLIRRLQEELTVLRPRRETGALADQLNTMISEMKRCEIGPDRLEEVIEQMQGDGPSAAKAGEGSAAEGPGGGMRPAEGSHGLRPAAEGSAANRLAADYLTLKLMDVLKVYRAYEEAIAGLYQDSEDYITYYSDLIPSSALLRGAQVWIYGFDTFTPKNLRVIGRLLETAEDVSVVLTYEGPGSEAGKTPAGAAGNAGQDPAAELPESLRTRARFAVSFLTAGEGAGLFHLTETVMQRLEETAEKAGRESRRHCIEGYFRPSIWTGKAGRMPVMREEVPAETPDPVKQRIHLVQASGTYAEAESAAAFIQSLVRDEGYRYGEIAVLCNDMDGRGRMLRRTFERWDIPAFADQKRKVLHQPVVSFLLSFLDVIRGGLEHRPVMGLVKSGLLGWTMEEESLLENYVAEFRIRGKGWKQDFVRGGESFAPEELKRLNEMRRQLVDILEGARESIGRRNTAEDKVRGLVTFLEDDFNINQRIREIVEREQGGRQERILEGAAETAQIWNAICGILDQIIQVVGGEKISNAQLREMVFAGLESLEIGLVPGNRDCVLMGTLQRSRPGKLRALVVTGANAGLLPLDAGEDGLLSRQDMQRLLEMDLEFADRQRVTQMEEQLAVYRMFSLPEDLLYVSCSQSGEDGSMLRPSEIFQKLQRWQPQVLGDLQDRPGDACVGSERATIPYLAEALREAESIRRGSIPPIRRKPGSGETADAGSGEHAFDGVLDEIWVRILGWYWEHDPAQARQILRGIRFDNHTEALGSELADALYRGDRQALEVSASRLEKYSGCPFAHFIQYGLRAREQRVYEVGSREIGDVYHRCLMRVSQILEEGKTARPAFAGEMDGEKEMAGGPAAAGKETEALRAAGEAVSWQNVSEEECRILVKQVLEEDTRDYREGLFDSDGYSRFRLERIAEICGDVAWTMVQQVRSGRIRSMYFEKPFRDTGAKAGGDGSDTEFLLPALEVEAGGRKVKIRGIIDRMDLIDMGEGQPEGVRIVDYKTGNNVIRPEYFRAGYKLQLMVYMDAALGAQRGEPEGDRSDLIPAGVFYYKIRDFNIDGDDPKGIRDLEDPDALEQKMKEFFRMEGIVVNDPALISAQDAAVDGTSSAKSQVIPVKYDPKKECYAATAGGTLLADDAFRELMEETNRQVQRICEEICRGEIAAVPKREAKKDRDGNQFTACRYCDYRSICGFDPSIPGCRYEDV